MSKELAKKILNNQGGIPKSRRGAMKDNELEQMAREVADKAFPLKNPRNINERNGGEKWLLFKSGALDMGKRMQGEVDDWKAACDLSVTAHKNAEQHAWDLYYPLLQDFERQKQTIAAKDKEIELLNERIKELDDSVDYYAQEASDLSMMLSEQ